MQLLLLLFYPWILRGNNALSNSLPIVGQEDRSRWEEMTTESFWGCEQFNDAPAAGTTESATPFIDNINSS
jgi:hypothetical protein